MSNKGNKSFIWSGQLANTSQYLHQIKLHILKKSRASAKCLSEKESDFLVHVQQCMYECMYDIHTRWTHRLPWSISLYTSHHCCAALNAGPAPAPSLAKGHRTIWRIFTFPSPSCFFRCLQGEPSSPRSEASQAAALAWSTCHWRGPLLDRSSATFGIRVQGKHFDGAASSPHYRTRADRKHMSRSGEVISCSTPEAAAISA